MVSFIVSAMAMSRSRVAYWYMNPAVPALSAHEAVEDARLVAAGDLDTDEFVARTLARHKR